MPGLVKSLLGGLLVLTALVFAPLASAQGARPVVKVAVIEAFSGAMANTGDALWRNLKFAVDRVNAESASAKGYRPVLELVQFDSKGQVEEALAMLRHAHDQGIRLVMQGNSSAVATALLEAVERLNRRSPDQKVLFLNYAAIDPVLTNEKCSPYHFRFDAHVDMRMHALTEVIKLDARIQKVYLVGQDYSFGHQVLRSAKAMLAAKRPDIQIVGEDLHPIGKVRDFAPYVQKIKASGAQAVITGNWGSDLTLLVKAAKESGAAPVFYTFFGNGLGVPAAIGEAGVGRVYAVSEWHPNAGAQAASQWYDAYRRTIASPQEDYFNLRHVAMVRMLSDALQQAGSASAGGVAQALRRAALTIEGAGEFRMRAQDQQIQLPLYVQVMESVASGRITRDVEGSGFGFRTSLYLPAAQTSMPTSCRMRQDL